MIGIDIIELDRVDTSDAFLNKIAHDEEIAYIKKTFCEQVQHERIASLFCVKEAVMKALGLGKNSGVVFKDIKLCHEESGKPYVELFGVAHNRFLTDFYGKKIEISISHSKTIATAIAIIM